MTVFTDRRDAGKKLAAKLVHYLKKQNTIILALPRGGVPVAYEVAKALHLPLDVFIVRKLGVPFNPELALGALAWEGTIVFNDNIVNGLDIQEDVIQAVVDKENKELIRRNALYREGRDFPDIRAKTVILIDDGLATGATASAAIMALRKKNPDRIIVAVPVGATSTCEHLRQEADEVICLDQPTPFYAVGQVYKDFTQTTDEEVKTLLRQAQ